MSTVQISARIDSSLRVATEDSCRSHWIVEWCRPWAQGTGLPRRLLGRGGGDD